MPETGSNRSLKFLCNLDEIPTDQGLRVEIAGYPPLAVFNLQGTVHVIDDTCTHGEASLSEGEIRGNEIECPFHLGAFDIRTGRPTVAPCSVPLRVYAVQVDGRRLMLVEAGVATACPTQPT